jgi:hypothetical protein
VISHAPVIFDNEEARAMKHQQNPAALFRETYLLQYSRDQNLQLQLLCGQTNNWAMASQVFLAYW